MSCSCHHNQPASCHHLNNHTGHTVLWHPWLKIERRLWCCHRKQEARSASEQSDNQGAVSASNFVSKPSWAELRMAVEVMMIGAGVTTNTADCQYCHPCQDSLLLSLLVPDDGDTVMSTTSDANPTTTLLISPIFHSQAASVSKLFTYGQLFSPQNAENIFSQTFVLVYQWTVIRRLACGRVWRISCVRFHKDFMLILVRRLRISNTPLHFLNSKLLVKNLWPKSFERFPLINVIISQNRQTTISLLHDGHVATLC